MLGRFSGAKAELVHHHQKRQFDGCYMRSFVIHSSAGELSRAQVPGQIEQCVVQIAGMIINGLHGHALNAPLADAFSWRFQWCERCQDVCLGARGHSHAFPLCSAEDFNVHCVSYAFDALDCTLRLGTWTCCHASVNVYDQPRESLLSCRVASECVCVCQRLCAFLEWLLQQWSWTRIFHQETNLLGFLLSAVQKIPSATAWPFLIQVFNVPLWGVIRWRLLPV